MIGLIDALNRRGFEGATSQRRYYGLYTGVVTGVTDPDGLYRVKVSLYHLHESGTHESFWARVATFMAGGDRGFNCLPEMNDEVVVGFVGGDDSQPIVLGSLWNSKDKTIDAVASGDGDKVERRTFKTRVGHQVQFVDKDGEETIQIKSKAGAIVEVNDISGSEFIHIIDKSGANFIKIDTAGKQIDVETDSSGVININSPDGTINVDCKDFNLTATNNITMKADTNVKIEAGSALETKSGADTKITADGNIVEKGSKIQLN